VGENSAIAWTDHTYNPWRGCTKVGPGCDHCYAEARDLRYESGKGATEARHWGPGAPRILASKATRLAPLKWALAAPTTGKRKVFCLSLGDVFDNEVDVAWRRALWDMVRITPNLRWQLVTKRVGNAADMMPSPAIWRIDFRHVGIISTVVDQDELDRDGPKLAKLKKRFDMTWVGLSIEPQLAAIDLRGYHEHLTPDWVITGGESRQPSGPPRPYDVAWARSLIGQCRNAGVAIFVKQLGARPVDSSRLLDMPEQPETADPSDVADFEIAICELNLRDRQAGADPSEWPADLRVREFPEALR
jgi:protein gp37